MLASKLSQLFFQSLRDIPPAQRFEYYERLNRKAKAEILPLAVASFVDQVSAAPTNEELRSSTICTRTASRTPPRPSRDSKSQNGPAFNTSRPTSPN